MNKGIIAAISLALCTPAAGAGLDSVYVYHTKGNVQYQCTSYLAYFETEGYGVVHMQGCEVSATDSMQWPVFLPQPISIHLSGPAFKQEWNASCQFVAHAMATSRSTSTVIDCR